MQVQKQKNQWSYEATVYLGELNTEFVTVQIYADPIEGHNAVCQPMTRDDKLPGAVNGYLYKGTVPAARPLEHFTLRIIPAHPAARIPLEDNHILWHSPASD